MSQNMTPVPLVERNKVSLLRTRKLNDTDSDKDKDDQSDERHKGQGKLSDILEK